MRSWQATPPRSAARSATGPDLSQVFLGSEGTLGVIVGSRLRVHPAPTHERIVEIVRRVERGEVNPRPELLFDL